jgi:iron complex transport system permease protein
MSTPAGLLRLAAGAPRRPGSARGRALRIGLALAAAASISIVIGVASGSTAIPATDVLRAFVGADVSISSEIVLEVRLPRVAAAFAAGGLLAYAGALMQVLFRNPLADPYVLGLSGGAAVGALGAMLLGLGTLFVNAGAFGGALLTVASVAALARRDLGSADGDADASPRLLLTGVMISAGWAAIIAMILIVAPESALRGMMFWMMGDLGATESWLAALVALPLSAALAFPGAKDLNAMLRGHDVAHALGVDVARARRHALALSSLATAIAVTTAGSIGFVGLVVPHALRLVIGNDQRLLLPASALAGGTLLVLADTVARMVFAPQQLPVGVVTAFLGVPAFIALLLRRRPAA